MFDQLPETFDYAGEFGAELVLFLPFCHWLSKAGLLKDRALRIYSGMSCFYDDLDCREVIEKSEARRFIFPQARPSWLPRKNEHDFDGLGRSPFHFYPDLRGKFTKQKLLPEIGTIERPLLIVHNKYNDEWNAGPINFIPLQTLDHIFRTLASKFTIVYIRHGMKTKDAGFSDDHNNPHPFDDLGLLDAYNDVLRFDDLYAAHRAQGGPQDVNTFKNVLYSRCFHFISSQGGGAHQIAMFSGSIMVILHRRGYESKWAYRDGYYGFMARVPPILAICGNYDELAEAVALLAGAEVVGDRVSVDAEINPLLRKFLPSALAHRQT